MITKNEDKIIIKYCIIVLEIFLIWHVIWLFGMSFVFVWGGFNFSYLRCNFLDLGCHFYYLLFHSVKYIDARIKWKYFKLSWKNYTLLGKPYHANAMQHTNGFDMYTTSSQVHLNSIYIQLLLWLKSEMILNIIYQVKKQMRAIQRWLRRRTQNTHKHTQQQKKDTHLLIIWLRTIYPLLVCTCYVLRLFLDTLLQQIYSMYIYVYLLLLLLLLLMRMRKTMFHGAYIICNHLPLPLAWTHPV